MCAMLRLSCCMPTCTRYGSFLVCWACIPHGSGEFLGFAVLIEAGAVQHKTCHMKLARDADLPDDDGLESSKARPGSWLSVRIQVVDTDKGGYNGKTVKELM